MLDDRINCLRKVVCDYTNWNIIIYINIHTLSRNYVIIKNGKGLYICTIMSVLCLTVYRIDNGFIYQ